MDSTHENAANQEIPGNMTSQKPLISTSDWKEVSNWRHLLQLNKDALENIQNPGSKETTIIPYGHDFEGVLIPRLLILHEYGLFFISGRRKQAPGSVEQLQDSEVWEECKRAQYVEFFIPHRTTSKKFIEALLKESQLQGIAFDFEGTKITGSSENDLEVAWYRKSSSRESLNDAEWENESVIPAKHDYSSYKHLAKVEAFYKEKPMFCSITTLGDEVDLLEVIEKHAKAADLKMNTELVLEA